MELKKPFNILASRAALRLSSVATPVPPHLSLTSHLAATPPVSRVLYLWVRGPGCGV